MVLLLVALAAIPDRVVTTLDLQDKRTLSSRVAAMAGQHRWMLFGSWSDKDRATLQKESLALAEWRVRDKAQESVNATSPSQKAQVANWQRQLMPGTTPTIDYLIKSLVLSLRPMQFPLQKEPSGKWFRIDRGGSPNLDRKQNELAVRLQNAVAEKFDDFDVKCYLLLRRISGRLVIYLSEIGLNGQSNGLATIPVPNNLGTSDDEVVAREIFPNTKVSPVKPGEIFEPGEMKAIPAKAFDLEGVFRTSFLDVLEATLPKVTDGVPVAILANDIDWLAFLPKGGNVESFLNSHGYRSVSVDNVRLVIPEFLWDAEDCRLNENALSKLSVQEDPMVVVRKYAQWLVSSNYLVSYDPLSYIEGALCAKRNLPLFSEALFPLAPALINISRSPLLSNTINLLGSNEGEIGNELLYRRIGDSFAFGTRASSELSLGYSWGEGGSQRLRDVSFSIDSGRRLKVPKLATAPFDLDNLARNITYFGRDWEEIERKAANQPVELVFGEQLTVAFSSTLGRVFIGNLFFQRKTLVTGHFKDLPKDYLDDLKAKTEDFLRENPDRDTAPPPPQTVQ